MDLKLGSATVNKNMELRRRGGLNFSGTRGRGNERLTKERSVPYLLWVGVGLVMHLWK